MFEIPSLRYGMTMCFAIHEGGAENAGGASIEQIGSVFPPPAFSALCNTKHPVIPSAAFLYDCLHSVEYCARIDDAFNNISFVKS